jgi:transcriptional regulator with XRE-family HTH domain
MRNERGWTQRELGDLAGVRQNWISHLESPDYGSFNLSTLKKLAFAFDVALIVRFVPFSQFVDWIANLEMRDLAPPGYDDDRALFEPVSAVTQSPMLRPEAAIYTYQQAALPLKYLEPSVVELRPRPVDRGQESTVSWKGERRCLVSQSQNR